MAGEPVVPAPPAGLGIIQRKLAMPPLPDHFAERPRLQRVLGDLLGRKRAVVISGTAGAGKTTAVIEATRVLERPIAWLTVDRSDTAPGRLVTYLEAALARCVPAAAGVGSRALAAGIAHSEAAGLLAESLGEEPVVFVVDELERLGDEPAAWGVIEALVRYVPVTASLVLISRRDIPAALCTLPSVGDVALVGDADVAFTAEEAARALAACGKAEIDAEAAVASTAGWVTGVLFEAWKSSEHVAGLGGESDPLNGYLASQILAELTERERDFLIATAPLDEVTAPRAEALGVTDAAQILSRLRSVHLPVTWNADGRVMRPHTRLHEYLLECLERRGGEEVRQVRLAHARLLVEEGQDESATEEFLRAGAPREAAAPAGRAIISVVDRLDFAVAERWLDALPDAALRLVPPFVTAELMIAISRDEQAKVVAIADRLAQVGEREKLAISSERAAWVMIWAYLHMARWEDVDAIRDATLPPGPELEALRYVMGALKNIPDARPPASPELLDGPLEAMAWISVYRHGLLAKSLEGPATRWEAALLGPWRIAALRAMGLTQQALELYESGRSGGVARGAMLTFLAPELLIDVGRREEARAVIEEGRRLALIGGSLVYLGAAHLMEAKLALRLDQDPEAAMRALDQPDCVRAAERLPLIDEGSRAWYGLALLLVGRDREALERLRDAVSSMSTNGRLLELPIAAVYLAEAEWRAGDEDAADRAANLALEAAEQQGSNHLLLQALADFPAVLSRRLDAEVGADSAWHSVGRALIAQGISIDAVTGEAVDLAEFGRRAISLAGREVKPRTAKSYELLAYLTVAADRRADRNELLDALFGERRDDSTRAYLRQAIRWLRMALPGGTLLTEGSIVQLAPDAVVRGESATLENRLAEAARLQGTARLTATLAALAIFERGPYLPGPRGPWADEREQLLAELTTDARHQAAELALELGRYDDTQRLVAEVLHADPYREAAWRLLMQVAGAMGDDPGVVRAFQSCEQALRDLGVEPSPTTRQLLGHLRR
jgi:DNA-binding SARP family transcriptional activator